MSMLWIILYIIILPFIISAIMDFLYISIISYNDLIDYDKYGPSGYFKIKQTSEIYTVLHIKYIFYLTIISIILLLLANMYKKDS